MRSIFTRAVLCTLCVLLAASANFQALAEEGEPVVVGAIVVEGLVTATEGATTITGEDLRREQPTTVDELFRNTPGVEGLQGPGRQFGDVNIRGVDGAGAVVVSVDGAEKNSVEVKHGIAFNPIFFNADFLKRVTVVKGAVSNVYGAGSIGGKIVLWTAGRSRLSGMSETSKPPSTPSSNSWPTAGSESTRCSRTSSGRG